MPKRLFVILLALILLLPTLAAAQPTAERSEAGRGLLAQLRDLLSVLWAENGSGLEPNGAHITSGTSGDTGSGLDPDGRP
jgi:hypothetical protein